MDNSDFQLVQVCHFKKLLHIAYYYCRLLYKLLCALFKHLFPSDDIAV